MPLTTVRTRTGLSIGAMPSGAARPVAPGFNYVQTMCLGQRWRSLCRQSGQRE